MKLSVTSSPVNRAALAAVSAAFAGEAVVRREDDGAAAEDFREGGSHGWLVGGLLVEAGCKPAVREDSPADAGMADIEREMQGRGGGGGIICCHDRLTLL